MTAEGAALIGWCIDPAGSIPETAGLDLERLGDLIDAQRVGPWLYRHSRPRLAGPLAEMLRERALRSTALTVGDDALRREVLAALLQEGIAPIPLKGAVIGPLLYGDAALRPAHDLDVLIGPTQWVHAKLVMKKLGFREVHRKGTPWLDGMSHEVAFWRGDELPVELHRNISQPRRFQVPVRELEARAVEWHWQGLQLRRLTDEDQFLHLVIHAAHHKFLIPLLHWVDLTLLLGRDLDLEAVVDRARRYHAEIPLRLAAERLTEWGFPGAVERFGRLSIARRAALRGMRRERLAMRADRGWIDRWYGLWMIGRVSDQAAFGAEYAARRILDAMSARAQRSRQLRSKSGWRSLPRGRFGGLSAFSPGRSGSPQASQ